ncbi:hypothetical protein IPA_01585 [Ignicoccus pacificus DSM 13166]|uniref:Uncharacterized protein n=1 Tax=Ignicoccus pacificus DSM 13166 TaxID=940294 RepID=A0A977KC10_9CREN|nr:hypothetical protein IPA_01585 [Ignicoccus pacificus DSM 13166]
MYIGKDYWKVILMLGDGFLASGNKKLAYFDFNGNKRWDVDIYNIAHGLAVYKGYVYVPISYWDTGALTILRLSDGGEVKTIDFDENVNVVQVCSHYLALGTTHSVYLYDISDPTNPKELWKFDEVATSCRGGCFGTVSIAFSPGCRYLVSADPDDHKIHLLDVATGKQVLEKKFEDKVWSVAWWGKFERVLGTIWWMDRIAVGLDNGKVYVFKVEGDEPQTTILIATRGTGTNVQGTPLPSYFSSVLAPYEKLRSVYDTLSKASATTVGIAALKKYFQSNMGFMVSLAQFGDLLQRMAALLTEAEQLLQKSENILNTKSDFNSIYTAMNYLQRAKVDLALINNTLKQLDEIVNELKLNKPTEAMSCGLAWNTVENIMKAKSVNEMYMFLSKVGGDLNKVVKTVISCTIEKVLKNYSTFRSELVKDVARLSIKWNKLNAMLTLVMKIATG